MNPFKKLTAILLVTTSALFTGCSFDLNSGSTQIQLPNTYGVYVEGLLNTPSFILEHDVKFDEIIIRYTVYKNDAYIANVKFYVSDDQTADNLKLPAIEEVLNVQLGLNESQKSGTFNSELIKTILNNKQPKFSIGVENLSANPLSTLLIDVDVSFKGTYSL